MKSAGPVLLAIGLLLVAAPFAGAQDEGQTSFTLVGYQDSATYWTLEGQTERNPTLTIPASTPITVTIKSETGVHDFQVGDNPKSEYVQEGGEPLTYTFTSPASGTVQYVCVVHKGTGMVGTFRVAGSDVTPTGGDGNGGGKESPGVALVGALVALAGAALVVGRRRS